MSDVETNTNNVPDDKKVSSESKPKKDTSNKEEKGGSCGC